MIDTGRDLGVPEDLSRLIIIEHDGREIDLDIVLASLRHDLVILIRNVDAAQADRVIQKVADRLGRRENLELQARFAGFHGHRRRIGNYFMSVNRRRDYQFIAPHSEGSSFVGMQLASFFCYENSTDGGETILMNVDDSSKAWECLREKVMRGKLEKGALAQHEIVRARGLYQLNLPTDVLKDGDRVLQERRSEISGLTVVEVLAKPKKTYSCILERKLNVFWHTIESTDFDSAQEYANLLKEWGLLREPPGGLDLCQLDSVADIRVWHSGVAYAQLFRCKIVRKLRPGDLVIQNNLTWTHAASNWSPDSGIREIAASFA